MRFGYMTCVLCLGLMGCTVAPLSTDERRARAAEDGGHIAAAQPAPTAPIQLYQAMARALLGNLDQRVRLMEASVANGVVEASSYDLLPQAMASAGWAHRNNDNASTSKTLSTGEISAASTSEDRNTVTSQLAVTWNVLDFGITWLKVRQNANRALIAEEQRRKTVQTLLQDVRLAWGKAVAAERLSTEIDPLIARVRTALASSQDIEAQRLQSPVQALDYQKQLLETLRQLLALRRDLGSARIELANLMGLAPQQRFQLALPGDDLRSPVIPMDRAALEERALLERPELREQDYQVRIAADEVRKTMLRLLPGLDFSAGPNYSSNSYLTNHSWVDAGLKVTWNLVNLPSAPANIRLAERQEELIRTRRMALHLAVLTQVNVAWQRVDMAREEFDLAKSLAQVDDRLHHHAQAALQSSAQSELEAIRAEVARAVSRLRRDMAYTEIQSAAAALRVSAGDDPILPATNDLAQLTLTLRRHYEPWDSPQEVPARVNWQVIQ